MELSSRRLRRELRDAGFANAAINAVWPQWWSDEAEGSLSAQGDLIFTVARRLGLSATALLEDRPEFVWRDDTKFKNIGDVDAQEQAILASFGGAVARALISLLPGAHNVVGLSPLELRENLLRVYSSVGFAELTTACWALGIPVVQLHVFPLEQKRMHAMAALVSGTGAIMLGVAHKHAARYAFIIAHELGHLALGHSQDGGSLVDMADPLNLEHPDEEERLADNFAMTVLTGTDTLTIQPDRENFSASQLAEVAARTGPTYGIDPGVLALATGYRTGRWPQAIAALGLLNPSPQAPGRQLNELAAQQLSLDDAPYLTQEYLRPILGLT